ncbi:hypothetical protein ACFY05_38065 [Microtetraspora fusca]|uniref:Uncharacterized protein n=1 Tax=Microtetraspora fusca TaxID=1997 RepID=A0ABW6VH31_MICFU
MANRPDVRSPSTRRHTRSSPTRPETEQFDDPEQWRFDWEQSYTRDQWLDLLPTTGGLTALRPDQRAEVLNAVGSAIDSLGGHFTMKYTTLAATAVRAGTS